MSIRQFMTDKEKESGVWMELPGFRVLCARFVHRSAEYQRYISKSKYKYRNAGAAAADLEQITLDICSDFIVKNWQTLVRDENGHESYRNGIEDWDTGDVVLCNSENVRNCLSHLPELASEIYEFATELENYRAEELEEDSGNSSGS